MDCVKRLGVMCKFMCQLDWAKGWPDIRSNLILSVSVKMFTDETNICIGRPSKKTALSNVGALYPISWRLHGSKTLTAWGNPSCLTAWDGTLLLSCLYTRTERSQLLETWSQRLLDCNLYHHLSWFSGLSVWTGTTPELSWLSTLLA